MKHLHRWIICFQTTLMCALCLVGYLHGAAPAYAEGPAVYQKSTSTEARDIEFLGRKVSATPSNRENDLSLILGGSFYAPELAGHVAAPIGTLDYKHRFDDLRVRGIFSIFMNQVDLAKNFDEFQLLGHLDNRTYPFTDTEVQAGEEVKGTGIKWGTVNGRIGGGWRLPVLPYEVDNDLRVQAYYQLGYLYSEKVAETGTDVVLPPNTVVHGPLLRVRYDGLHRNLLDLPDLGLAVGGEAQYQMRNNWSDANYGGNNPYPKGQTERYFKLSSYFVVATGLPYLSDQNRLLTRFQGAFVATGILDRFSAFRVGGGPISYDSDEIDRLVYPGAMFNQFPVNDYVIGSLEYRREISPFLFLHLRGTFTRVSRELFTPTNHGHFVTENGHGIAVGLTSAFYCNSQLHLEYAYDTKMLRNGAEGSNIVLLLSTHF